MIHLVVKQHDRQKMNATFNGWNSHITMDGNEFHGEYVCLGVPLLYTLGNAQTIG